MALKLGCLIWSNDDQDTGHIVGLIAKIKLFLIMNGTCNSHPN